MLAGDSAHTADFTIGMGATLAIGDTIALVGKVLRRTGISSRLRDSI